MAKQSEFANSQVLHDTDPKEIIVICWSYPGTCEECGSEGLFSCQHIDKTGEQKESSHKLLCRECTRKATMSVIDRATHEPQ